MEQNVRYFENHGAENTPAVIEVVRERLEQGDVTAVVVASSSGETALEFARELGDAAPRLIAIAECAWVRRTLKHEPMAPAIRAELTERGVEICSFPHVSGSFSWIGMDNVHQATDLNVLLFDVFRMVGGQGFKVAMEVGMMATNAGLVEPGERLIAVGGTLRGSDCAIVMPAAFSNDLLSQDAEKRPTMRELLCLPLTRSWFW